MADYSKYIWDYFKPKLNNNEYAVAGLMGNLQAESGLKPNNLQNSYEKSLGYTDDAYTKAVDNGTYSQYSFVHDSAGYGLAQWTYYSRKQNMYNKYKSGKYSSIGCIELGCDFLYDELQAGGYISRLSACKSILQASNIILLEFERPLNQGTSVQEKRANFGQQWYNKYKGTNTSISQGSIKKAYIRSTQPEPGNKFYNTKGVGGYSTCVVGSDSSGKCTQGLNVLPNCVGFANGAFNEMVNSIRGENKQYYSLNRNAELFLQVAAEYDDLKENILGPNEIPRVGCIMVWAKGQVGNSSDGAGHVAFVYKVTTAADGTVTVHTAESGWASSTFWTKTRTNANGRWGSGTKYTFIGCVAPPSDVQKHIDTNDNPTTSPAKITAVEDVDNDTICIKGEMNGTSGITNGVRLYYKYNSDTVSDKSGEYDGTINVTVSNNTFTVNFDRDRSKNKIAIVARQLNSDSTLDSLGPTFVKLLVVTIPCMPLYVNGKWKNTIPYIYTGGTWKKVLPTIYTGGVWHQLWNKNN